MRHTNQTYIAAVFISALTVAVFSYGCQKNTKNFATDTDVIPVSTTVEIETSNFETVETTTISTESFTQPSSQNVTEALTVTPATETITTEKTEEIPVSVPETTAFIPESTTSDNSTVKTNGPLKDFVDGVFFKLIKGLLKNEDFQVDVEYVNEKTLRMTFKLLDLTIDEKTDYAKALESGNDRLSDSVIKIKELIQDQSGVSDLNIVCRFVDENGTLLYENTY